MSSVVNILKKKTHGIVSVSPQTSVLEALKIMADKNIGSVVVAEDGAFLGLLTERDYARKVILQHKHSDDTLVSDIMSTDLPRIGPLESTEKCMLIMTEHHVRYLPVFENGTLIGIVSILDLIQDTVDNQKETIHHLQNFISGQFG